MLLTIIVPVCLRLIRSPPSLMLWGFCLGLSVSTDGLVYLRHEDAVIE